MHRQHYTFGIHGPLDSDEGLHIRENAVRAVGVSIHSQEFATGGQIHLLTA